MSSPLLVNLSILFAQPTGIATYAANLFSYLKPLDPTLLISPLTSNHFPLASDFHSYPVPANLSPAHGTKGHFRRLLWTQFKHPFPSIPISSRWGSLTVRKYLDN
ncbi:MAG: hypothetical protein RID53_30570 [Coleofasciculus sp. B1-GNL1-01]|uniref:hypothetical protein n=1 Tax=Coleofasciculus sp. B1-GNL1-01 TaxID=3068484 RepID=UPI0032FB529C